MMLTPCWPSAGPTGGAGVAAPAWICSLMTAASFFFGGMSLVLLLSGDACCRWARPQILATSDLRDLVELELDRRLATEDRHQHLEALRVEVHLADRRRQGGERAVGDGDRLPDRVLLCLRRLDPLLLDDRRQDRRDLLDPER